mmetsp:Transcript_28098/g.49226  ORF Transcript_28098/g.49226 Transcript_28098/m.49226 type:complete len:99 (-) Transcript_28098:11-307(-)
MIRIHSCRPMDNKPTKELSRSGLPVYMRAGAVEGEKQTRSIVHLFFPLLPRRPHLSSSTFPFPLLASPSLPPLLSPSSPSCLVALHPFVHLYTKPLLA